MPIHLHPLSNEIGVITHSQARFQAIAEALKEPCVWLNQHNADGAEHSYEVVIIDRNPSVSTSERNEFPRERLAKAVGESPMDPDTKATWRHPGLFVYQCTEEETTDPPRED